MTSPEIEFDWLDLLRRRVKYDKNNLVVVVGETGSGKSLAALDAAHKLDPLFSIDHCVFSVPDFLERVQAIMDADAMDPPRQVCRTLIFDEAAVGFDARRSMSKENIEFSNLLKIFRYLNISVFFTFPNLEMFDVNGRRLIHFLVVMSAIDRAHAKSYAHLFMVDSHKSFGGEPKRYFPVIDVPNMGLRFQLDPIKFSMPPLPLRKAYKGRKDIYMQQMMDRMARSWSSSSADKEDNEPEVAPPISSPTQKPPRQKIGRAFP